VILRGATLIDGSGAPPVRDRAVVVDERRIGAILTDRGPHDEAVLDLGGLTLLPGLINCHVHLCLSGEADPSRTLTDETYAATVVSAVVRARRTVEAGVTTVRDLGGREYAELAVRDAVRAGVIPGPRVLCAGRAVCITGGHGWRLLGRQADGADDLRRAVREQLRAGADVIKLVATGGVMTPGVDPRAAQLTLEELRAGVDEAHRARRRAAAHAMADEGIAWCLDAGIDTIEHGVFLTDGRRRHGPAARAALGDVRGGAGARHRRRDRQHRSGAGRRPHRRGGRSSDRRQSSRRRPAGDRGWPPGAEPAVTPAPRPETTPRVLRREWTSAEGWRGTGVGMWAWLIQRAAAVALLVVIAAHLVNPFRRGVQAALLGLALLHALLGVRALLLDVGLPVGWHRGLFVGALVVAAAIFAGVWLLRWY
jgi:succinate dehydrogenase hydrophobic anchor subunit